MGFEKCHPAVNFIFFAGVIAGTVAFQHPIFLVISFACAFLYSIKRNGWKALVFNIVLLLLIAGFALYYSSYHHFGVTVMEQNMIGNNMTLESLVYGCVLGAVITGVLMWFSCVLSVCTTDKVVYLFGKVSPRLSLFLAIALRMIPRIKKEAKKINTAQKGIGRGINQGNIFQRLRNSVRILSMLITWTIESLTTTSESMRSRGSTLRGRKAFSIYRFDDRDRMALLCLGFCGLYLVCGVIASAFGFRYFPSIRCAVVNTVTLSFQAVHFGLCIMPVVLNAAEERTWKAIHSKM